MTDWKAKGGLSCAFDGVRNAFTHPLSGECLRFRREFRSVDEAGDAEGAVQPVPTAGDDELDPDARRVFLNGRPQSISLALYEAMQTDQPGLQRSFP